MKRFKALKYSLPYKLYISPEAKKRFVQLKTSLTQKLGFALELYGDNKYNNRFNTIKIFFS